LQLCLSHCELYGAAYMATQYGQECWCDVTGTAEYDRHGGEEDGAVCGMPCAGNEVRKRCSKPYERQPNIDLENMRPRMDFAQEANVAIFAFFNRRW